MRIFEDYFKTEKVKNNNIHDQLLDWLETEKPLVFEKYKQNIEVRDDKILVNGKNGITEEDQNALTGIISTYFLQHPE